MTQFLTRPANNGKLATMVRSKHQLCTASAGLSNRRFMPQSSLGVNGGHMGEGVRGSVDRRTFSRIWVAALGKRSKLCQVSPECSKSRS
jgi:hypothetical protein